MDKFWELIKDGTILIAIIALAIVGTYLAMTIMEIPMPESLDRAFWTVLGLVTGGVVGAGLAIRSLMMEMLIEE